MPNHKPIIAVTMGDPAGVGPEVCLRLLANQDVFQFAVPIVFGDIDILRRCAKAIGVPAPTRVITEHEWSAQQFDPDSSAVLHLPGFDQDGFEPGIVGAKTGQASYHYILRSIEAAMTGKVAAVTTGPINKEALHAAGIFYPGHTEIFEEKTGASRACMFQYSEEVRASFVTTHVGYAEVPALLTQARILDVIELTAEAIQRICTKKPKLGILGLNPHAGENGLFGNREEELLIIPAMHAARAKGIEIDGPFPPDTAFLPARRKSYDAMVCMYHDQGHIPLKALAFDNAVNTTLGLSIIRTSVDHGTACDIAWKGIANPGSMFEAVRLAAKLSI